MADIQRSFPQRDLEMTTTLEGDRTMVTNGVQGQTKERGEPESLRELVAYGEAGVGVVERTRNDLERAKVVIEERIGECRGLLAAAGVLPAYLTLARQLRCISGEDKITLQSGEWQKDGKPGMIMLHPRRNGVGLVITQQGNKFSCRFLDGIELIEAFGRQDKDEFLTVPDRTGPNPEYLPVKFAKIEQFGTLAEESEQQ